MGRIARFADLFRDACACVLQRRAVKHPSNLIYSRGDIVSTRRCRRSLRQLHLTIHVAR